MLVLNNWSNVAELSILNQDTQFQIINSSNKIIGSSIRNNDRFRTSSFNSSFHLYTIAVLEISIK
jgi:hypothetical protein